MSSGDPRSDLPTWLAGAGVGLVLILIAVLGYQLGFNRGEQNASDTNAVNAASAEVLKESGAAPAEPKKEEKPPPSGPGLEGFKTSCAGCHTLAAAGASGTTGPNLDAIKPDAAVTLAAIKNGGSGAGAMPKNLVTGKEADQVAEFVAEYAGQ